MPIVKEGTNVALALACGTFALGTFDKGAQGERTTRRVMPDVSMNVKENYGKRPDLSRLVSEGLELAAEVRRG